jgi:type I restriction enzyme M protein
VDIILTNPPFGGKEEDGIESNFPNHPQTRETADLFPALIVRLLKSQGSRRRGPARRHAVRRRREDAAEGAPAGECNLHTIVRLPNGVFNPYTGIKTNHPLLHQGP